MHVIFYFKCLSQICTKVHGSKFNFSNIFWECARQAPYPDPSLVFFSSSALGSDFALNYQVLRALDSGFALTFD